jgi:RNA polymerase sigma factor (sigma-70 family)
VGRIDNDLLPRIVVQSYLGHLPARDRQILSLEFFEDLPLKKIAEELGVSVSATRMARARALNRLRNLLFEEARTLDSDLESPKTS